MAESAGPQLDAGNIAHYTFSTRLRSEEGGRGVWSEGRVEVGGG